MYLFIGTTTAMIVLVMYIKKKKPEPYIVIRKETVAVKANEKSWRMRTHAWILEFMNVH